jgi:diguanylate cyclase (GGDEF)-like protein
MRNALNGLRARWRQAVERHPQTLIFGLLMLMAPLVLWLSWLQSSSWEQAQVRAAVTRADSLLSIRQEQAAGDLDVVISQFKDLPELLASEPKLIQLLERPGDTARLRAANKYLKDIARYLQVDLAWLIDARGLTLAANNHDEFESLVRVSFLDRRYFTEAIAGRPGRQYAVGRRTSIPGLYFSFPVRAASGRIMGVVVVKTDLPKVASRIRKNGIFVADDLGVVILSERKELLFNAVPGAPILKVDQDTRQKRYRRTDFPLLRLVPADARRFPDIQLLGDKRIPVLHREFAIPENGLSVHLVEELDQLSIWRSQRLALFWVLAFGAMAALWAVWATLIYTQRARLYRKSIELTNIELLRLNDRLKHQAESDFLTGCMNRRSFDEKLNQEISRSQRQDYPLSIALLDLDHFKRINDTYGHATGDAMLRHFAHFVQANIRLSDSFARLGGEEFAVLMPDTDEAAAVPLIERLRGLVAHAPLALENGPLLTITVSIGLTTLCATDVSKTFIRRADEALYAAKAAGRNRTIYAPCPHGQKEIADSA